VVRKSGARTAPKQLFVAEHANVQPHSGSQANAAALHGGFAAGATPFLGLDLARRRPSDPRAQVEFQRKLYKPTFYTVRRDTGDDRLRRAGRPLPSAKSPKVIMGGGQRVSKNVGLRAHASIADKVGATLHLRYGAYRRPGGGGVHPSPVPHAHITTTTTHKTLRGPAARD